MYGQSRLNLSLASPICPPFHLYFLLWLLTFVRTRSLVIDEIDESIRRDETAGLAYIYFHYTEQERQDPTGVLACLVKQLASHKSNLPPPVEKLYGDLKPEKRAPDSVQLLSVLAALLGQFTTTMVVLDALDECEEKHLDQILSVIEDLQRSGAKLLVTSRPHRDRVQRAMQNADKIDIVTQVDDLKTYITTKLANSVEMQGLPTDIKEDIFCKVVENGSGMFVLSPYFCSVDNFDTD